MKELPEICPISYNNRPKGVTKNALIGEWWNAGMITPQNKYEIAKKLGITRRPMIYHLSLLYLNGIIGDFFLTKDQISTACSNGQLKIDPTRRIERAKKANKARLPQKNLQSNL